MYSLVTLLRSFGINITTTDSSSTVSDKLAQYAEDSFAYSVTQHVFITVLRHAPLLIGRQFNIRLGNSAIQLEGLADNGLYYILKLSLSSRAPAIECGINVHFKANKIIYSIAYELVGCKSEIIRRRVRRKIAYRLSLDTMRKVRKVSISTYDNIVLKAVAEKIARIIAKFRDDKYDSYRKYIKDLTELIYRKMQERKLLCREDPSCRVIIQIFTEIADGYLRISSPRT